MSRIIGGICKQDVLSKFRLQASLTPNLHGFQIYRKMMDSQAQLSSDSFYQHLACVNFLFLHLIVLLKCIRILPDIKIIIQIYQRSRSSERVQPRPVSFFITMGNKPSKAEAPGKPKVSLVPVQIYSPWQCTNSNYHRVGNSHRYSSRVLIG